MFSHATGTVNGGTTGGTAILFSKKLTRYKPPAIKQVGHNWCAIILCLRGGGFYHIVTSYTRHGDDLTGVKTMHEIEHYLKHFHAPPIMGG